MVKSPGMPTAYTLEIGSVDIHNVFVEHVCGFCAVPARANAQSTAFTPVAGMAQWFSLNTTHCFWLYLFDPKNYLLISGDSMISDKA